MLIALEELVMMSIDSTLNVASMIKLSNQSCCYQRLLVEIQFYLKRDTYDI